MEYIRKNLSENSSACLRRELEVRLKFLEIYIKIP